MTVITHSRLSQVLRYDPVDGKFVWIANTGKKRMIGCQAGYIDDRDGRIYIRIDGRMYVAARLEWLYVHGAMPVEDIDHINGNPNDNRLENLREASRTQNMANKKRHKNNKSGVKGVHYHKSTQKWRAIVRVNGKNNHIGLFSDKYEAGRAYFAAAQRIFGEFATVRS